MKSILNALRDGFQLKPMDSAGSFFEDGFYLTKTENGLTGFSEVLTADVLELERKGLIFWNHIKWQYVLTKKGQNADQKTTEKTT